MKWRSQVVPTLNFSRDKLFRLTVAHLALSWIQNILLKFARTEYSVSYQQPPYNKMKILTQEQVEEISLRKMIKYVQQNKLQSESVPMKRKSYFRRRVENWQRLKACPFR